MTCISHTRIIIVLQFSILIFKLVNLFFEVGIVSSVYFFKWAKWIELPLDGFISNISIISKVLEINLCFSQLVSYL